MPIQFMYWVVIITTKQDKANAMELWKQATKLGSSEAQYRLGICHSEGEGFEESQVPL